MKFEGPREKILRSLKELRKLMKKQGQDLSEIDALIDKEEKAIKEIKARGRRLRWKL